jgi:hypothetical protein
MAVGNSESHRAVRFVSVVIGGQAYPRPVPIPARMRRLAVASSLVVLGRSRDAGSGVVITGRCGSRARKHV